MLLEKNIFDYLSIVDRDFPIPLSNKVDIATYSQKIAQKADVFYEETQNGEIIAMVVGYIRNAVNKEGYIALVSVKKNYRKQGIAEKLVRRFLNEAQKADLRQVHLYTHKSNWKAILMYEKIGFTEDQDNSGYRFDDIHFIYTL